ncbi:hypothetical protein P7C70_g2108, partial [Phenoliferia sp. Uapishka_3]
MTTASVPHVDYHLGNSLGPFVSSDPLDDVGNHLTIQFELQMLGSVLTFGVLVAILMVIDIVGTIASFYQAYTFVVLRWGDVAFLQAGRSTWGFNINPAVTGVTAAIVQSFYACKCHAVVLFRFGPLTSLALDRVWVINGKSYYVPAIILGLGAVQLGFAIGGSYICFSLPINQWRERYTFGVYIWLGSEALADALITASIVWFLRREKSKAAFDRTNTVLSRIIRMTMENNGATAVVAMTDAAVFAVTSSTWYQDVPTSHSGTCQLILLFQRHACLNMILPKIYTLSFIITLNSRRVEENPTPSIDTRRVSLATSEFRFQNRDSLASMKKFQVPQPSNQRENSLNKLMTFEIESV